MTDTRPARAPARAPSRASGRAPDRTPVMADVARLAGVSLQTVSRVVNGGPHLRPSTREKVEHAIAQLGYRPNVVARSLVTRRSGVIGLIATKSEFYGPSTIHRAVQGAARDAGFFVSSLDLDEVTRGSLAEAVDHLRDQRVEGIVMNAANDEAVEIARQQQTGGVPVVVVEGDLSRASFTVGVDQRAGALLATEHLLGLGHRRIAHVAGPQEWTEARARLEGWRTALHAAGLRPAEPLRGDWSVASGYDAGRRLAADAETTAVFVGNDHMAIGVMHALHEAGRDVPGEVSVVGFDDLPESEYLIPPLTTVRQDFASVGRRAIEVLQEALAPVRAVARRGERLLKPVLVLRHSTAPVGSRPARDPRGRTA